MLEEEIKTTLDSDCWKHMRNIICNGIEIELRNYLHNMLEVDLAIILYHLRVKFYLDNLCRMCDKEFNRTANYNLGHREQFMKCMETHRLGELMMPIVLALSVKRQDGSFEGDLPVFMACHYFVAFLRHYLCCTDSDNIIQNKLFITLSCVEVISELRIASIFFIAFIVLMRWLSGNTHKLVHRDWGERSMPSALDLMYNKFI